MSAKRHQQLQLSIPTVTPYRRGHVISIKLGNSNMHIFNVRPYVEGAAGQWTLHDADKACQLLRQAMADQRQDALDLWKDATSWIRHRNADGGREWHNLNKRFLAIIDRQEAIQKNRPSGLFDIRRRA